MLTSLPFTAVKGDKTMKSNKKLFLKCLLCRENLLNKVMEFVEGRIIDDIFCKGKDEKFRQMWKMTKILEFHEGRDKKIQGVTLKTPTGVIKITV